MKINRREKLLLIGMLIVIIAWLSFDFFIEDQLLKIDEKQRLINSKEEELKSLEELLLREEEFDKEIEENYKIVDEVAKNYFNTTPQEQMILLYSDFFAMPSVSVTNIDFEPPMVEDINEISFEKNSINVSFEGPYLNIMNILKTVWDFSKEIQISDMNINASGYDEVSGSMTLDAYTFLAESSVVDGLYQFYIDENFMKENPFQQYEESEALVRYLYLKEDDELFNYDRFFNFVDIEDYWLQSEIEEFLEYGYLYLSPTLEFGPDEPISRGEFIVLLDSVYGWELDAYEDADLTTFRDYDDLGSLQSSFAKAVQKGFLSGYITGYEDSTLRPRDPITYQEVEFLMNRIKGRTDFIWENVTDRLAARSGQYKSSWYTNGGLLTKAEAVYLLYYFK